MTFNDKYIKIVLCIVVLCIGIDCFFRIGGVCVQNVTDEQLCSLSQSGDTDARDRLVVRYISLVGARAAVYANQSSSFECEDLGQEGFIGLVYAIDNYNPSFGASFRTFAALNIDRRITDAVRTALRKRQVPDNVKVALSNEQIASNDDPENTAILRDTLNRIFADIESRTSDLERKVLALSMNGYSYAEIAKRVGSSSKGVENALARVRRKLNK